MNLDQLECLSVAHQKTDFPDHYHETFCISLIHKGVECIALNGIHFYSELNSITITNPYEVHANPLIDKDVDLAFDTLYVSTDLMKYLLAGQNINFSNRKIEHEQAVQLFLQIKNAINQKSPQQAEQDLQEFAKILAHYAQPQSDDYQELIPLLWQNVNDYIEANLTDKLNLEQLAKITNLNKYSFAKKFKTTTGMSPINFILMKKIFAAKQVITPYTELTDLAYQYDFADLAHFSKTFKRFVGISPKQYQNNLPRLYK